jgi:hypothetical protein
MIPQFPSFKKLTPDDREEIETITHEHDPYSDFNFSSMWAYNTEEDFEISRINNNIIIRFQDYITNKRFYSFTAPSCGFGETPMSTRPPACEDSNQSSK